MVPRAGGDDHHRQAELGGDGADHGLRAVAAGHAEHVDAARGHVAHASGASPPPAGARPVRSLAALHSSTRWNRSALPPPDLRFMNSTPRFAGPTGVPSTSAALRDATVVPKRVLRERHRPISARILAAMEKPSKPSAFTTVTARPIAAAAAMITATPRRCPVLVKATHTAARNTTSKTSPVSTLQRFVGADRERGDDDPDDEQDRHDRRQTATGRGSRSSHSSSLATRGVGLIDMGP